MKYFLGKKGETCSMKKKPDNPHKDVKSPEATIHENKETITTNEQITKSVEPTHKSTNEEDLVSLFEQ